MSVAALGLARVAHSALLGGVILSRPACIPSACYLVVLILSLQCPQLSRRVLVRTLSQSGASALLAAVSLGTTLPLGARPGLPDPWWPDILVLAGSVVLLALTARSGWLKGRATGADAEVGERTSSVAAAECGVGGMSIVILGFACICRPSLVGTPLLVAALVVLLMWGCGTSLEVLGQRLRLCGYGMQVYAGCWLMAAYGVQLAINMGAHELPILETFGFVRLGWLESTSSPRSPSCDGAECNDFAAVQFIMLLGYLFWEQFVGPAAHGGASFLSRALSPSAWAARGAQTADALLGRAGAHETLSQPLLGAMDDPARFSRAERVGGAPSGAALSSRARGSPAFASVSAASGALLLVLQADFYREGVQRYYEELRVRSAQRNVLLRAVLVVAMLL